MVLGDIIFKSQNAFVIVIAYAVHNRYVCIVNKDYFVDFLSSWHGGGSEFLH